MNLIKMAKKFLRLWQAEATAKEGRKEIGAELMATMLRSGETQIELPGGTVHYVRSVSKRVSKGDIVSFFGPEKAEEFWATVPESASEYLTVREPKTERKTA